MGRGTVFWHLLEIARTQTDREQASFRPNASLASRLSLSLVAMLSQLRDQAICVARSRQVYMNWKQLLIIYLPG